jgi:hypothetical protein
MLRLENVTVEWGWALARTFEFGDQVSFYTIVDTLPYVDDATCLSSPPIQECRSRYRRLSDLVLRRLE